MRIFCLLLIGIFAGNGALTQHASTEDQTVCGTTILKSGDILSAISSALTDESLLESSEDSIFIIPLIIHVLHLDEAVGEGENLSSEQIYSQIEVLNEDFGRLAETPGFNDNPASSNSNISFRPAMLGPDGFPLQEAGIHRINILDFEWESPPYTEEYINTFIKPATIWDPKRYCNIWLTNTGPVSGWAQFPDNSGLSELKVFDGSPNTDGIIIKNTDFGRIGNLMPLHNFGRTATHEMGHWLGLRHVWGDGDCDADDGCNDTPKAAGPNIGCLANPQSCGTADMSENYMDISSGFCRNTFTNCQIDRMQKVLENSPRRKELAYSPVIELPTTLPEAAFRFEATTNCSGTIRFEDLSAEHPFFWRWDFGNGITDSVPNPIISYDRPGTYIVRLEVSNFLGTSTYEEEVNICLTSGQKSLSTKGISIAPPSYQDFASAFVSSATFSNSAHLQLMLLDPMGRKVQKLFDDHVPAGSFDLPWEIDRRLTAGIYFLSWQIGSQRLLQKLIIR